MLFPAVDIGGLQNTCRPYSDAKTPARVANELHLLPEANSFADPATLPGDGSGGRCRIRTYDFHRVKVTLYR